MNAETKPSSQPVMTAGQLVCESVEARRYKKEDCGIAKKKDITPGGFERRPVTTQPDGGRVDAKSEDGRTNDDGRRERILRLIVRT